MSVTPTLDLFHDDSYSPHYYWVDVVINAGDNYKPVSHGSIPQPDSAGDVEVEVNVQSQQGGPHTHQVDLGQIDFPGGEGTVTIVLKDGATTVGGGTVSTADAKEASRPGADLA